ncbi:MAG: ABC transporter permease, partial [Firmicutes bacterium]|nr:ABC transporter permease [Bacillota bacterium]
MKIILKYIMNNIKERKMRTAVMLLSVVMSTTLLFVSLSIGNSYESAQQKMAKGVAGAATTSISARPNADGQMVWIAEEDVPESASIKNKVGIVETHALYSEDGYFDNFYILAADLEGLNQINKPRLLNGAELTDFNGYDIVLPEKFTSKYKLQPGAKVTLRIEGTPITFNLVAVAAYDTVFLRSTRGFNALVPKETLQQILNISNEYNKILIEPAEGVNTPNIKAELANSLPSDRYSITAVYNEAQVAADAL